MEYISLQHPEKHIKVQFLVRCSYDIPIFSFIRGTNGIQKLNNI